MLYVTFIEDEYSNTLSYSGYNLVSGIASPSG